MNEQSTILNGPSGELTMAFKDAKSLQETTHQPASGNVQLPANFPPQNSVSRPPLTRVDSRTFTPRPNFPNQQGVPYRPPPVRQPGAPQFIQRNTGGFVQRPPGPQQQQHQQQLPLQQNFQNARLYGNVNINPSNQNQNQGPNQNINPGIRPSTPFPPRPQGPIVRPAGLIAQRSVPALGQTRPPFNGDQLTRSQTLDTSEIPKHDEINKPTISTTDISKEETPKPAVVAMKNRSFSLSSNAESNSSLNEDRRRSVSSIGSVDENATDEKNDHQSRPESRAGFMNKIEEDVSDCKTNRLDSPLVVSHETSKIVESAKVNQSPEIKLNENKTDHVRIGETLSKEDDENIKDAKTEKEPSKLRSNATDRIKPPKTLSPAKSEGDNDSGVDESTQGNDQSSNGEHNTSRKSSSKTPSRNSSSPTKSRSFSRGSKSPHPKTPDSGASTPGTTERKKLPMNKIQVGSAPSPNLKVVKSKIGSLENASYKPGGGRVKIENRKLDFSNAQPRIAAKNDVYQPGGGDKKIQQQKLQWNAKSKIGSLENAAHKPKGGDKKIETVKLDFKEKAKPKIGSKDNIKHVPGGGDVKSEEVQEEVKQEIENKKLEIKVQSKVGSLDNVKHKPGGGDKKIFDDKEYIRQKSSMSNENKSMSGSQIKQVKKVTYEVDTVEISVVPSKKEKVKIFETVYESSDSRPSSRHSRSGSTKSKSIATPREPWRY